MTDEQTIIDTELKEAEEKAKSHESQDLNGEVEADEDG